MVDISITEGNLKPRRPTRWRVFYLMFSEPDLISLDECVFNTEAHPLKRLLP
jgi:hypothetical protein